MQRKAFHKYHIQQGHAGSEGLTCLAIVRRCLGVSSPWSQALMAKSKERTTLQTLKKAGKAAGLAVKGYRTNLSFLQDCESPCILAVLQPDLTNGLVVFYGYDKQRQRYWVGHPSQHQPLALREDELDHIWVSRCLLKFEKDEAGEHLAVSGPEEVRKLLFNHLRHFRYLLGTIAVLALILTGISVTGLMLFSNFCAELLHPTSAPATSWFQVISVVLFFGGLLFSLRYVHHFLCARLSVDLNSTLRKQFTERFSAMRILPAEQNELLGDLRRTVDLLSSFFQTGSIGIFALVAVAVISFYYDGITGALFSLVILALAIILPRRIFSAANRLIRSEWIPESSSSGADNTSGSERNGSAFHAHAFGQRWSKASAQLKTGLIVNALFAMPLLFIFRQFELGILAASSAFILVSLGIYSMRHLTQMATLLFDWPRLYTMLNRLRTYLQQQPEATKTEKQERNTPDLIYPTRLAQ